jgi:CIC family chloride channel protein
LLGACLTAYGLADFLGDRPVYEALLERDLLRGEPTSTLESALLLELTLAPGAPFEGRRIRELGLPPGCVVITVRRSVNEHVPSADFRLEAGDRMTAIVAPEAAAAAALLRAGTSGEHR